MHSGGVCRGRVCLKPVQTSKFYDYLHYQNNILYDCMHHFKPFGLARAVKSGEKRVASSASESLNANTVYNAALALPGSAKHIYL